MRPLISLCCAAALVAGAVAAPVPQPTPREVPQLVAGLGSEDFAEREAATKRLDELGLLALAELRAATASDNPEVASRAKDLVRKIERRAANERAIAPTLVELDFTDAALDTVLAALSRQSGAEVVLGGPGANEMAAKKVTVKTGKVPFWAAVVKVCERSDLQVAAAGGFVAPGANPLNPRPGKLPDGTAVRVVGSTERAVVLEARTGPPRPAFVSAGVLVEAFALPKEAASKAAAASVIQVWPEPKLGWQASADAKVTKATDAGGLRLIPDFTPAAVPKVQRLNGGVIVLRNADGSVTLVNPGAADPVAVGPNFAPNARQSLVKLKTDAPLAAELTGSVFGLVRSGVEPLAVAALDPDKAVTARGAAGSEFTAALRTEKGKTFVDVRLTYEPQRVQPAGPRDDLAGAKFNAAGSNGTTFGLRATDADGKAFDLSVTSHHNTTDATGQRNIVRMTLELVPPRGGIGDPAKLTLWGTYAKPVEVPFALKNVPLAGGSK